MTDLEKSKNTIKNMILLLQKQNITIEDKNYIKQNYIKLYNKALATFGNWNATLKYINSNNTQRSKVDWDKNKIISIIKINSDCRIINMRKKYGNRLIMAGVKLFGSWDNALIESGVMINKKLSKERIYKKWDDITITNLIDNLKRENKEISSYSLKKISGSLFNKIYLTYGGWENFKNHFNLKLEE
jgi:hypothetical protein